MMSEEDQHRKKQKLNKWRGSWILNTYECEKKEKVNVDITRAF